jgi:DNA-binding CsgD family transcriptional regulator
MTSNRVQAAIARLARIGMTAPDHLTAQAEALVLIREVVPYDVGSFATIDPATVLWTSCVLNGIEPDPRREMFMFDNEYRHDDLLKISTLAQSPQPAARLSAVDPETLERSARYQVFSGLGAVDELRCALVDSGNCWGSFELGRGVGLGEFTDDDVRNAALLSGPLARLVRLSLLRQAASLPEAVDDPPGMLVVDRNGEIGAKSPASERWLQELNTGSGVPPVIRALVMRLTGDNEDAISMVAPRASGGWLRLHAAPLDPGAQSVSVVLEPVKTATLPETVATAYGFTPRECEVITWMARGLSAKEIGGRLGISTFTVNDHAKAIFQKAGVQSRQQLIAALFFDHCLPLRERDAIPGPYGWFLDAGHFEQLSGSGSSDLRGRSTNERPARAS